MICISGGPKQGFIAIIETCRIRLRICLPVVGRDNDAGASIDEPLNKFIGHFRVAHNIPTAMKIDQDGQRAILDQRSIDPCPDLPTRFTTGDKHLRATKSINAPTCGAPVYEEVG